MKQIQNYRPGIRKSANKSAILGEYYRVKGVKIGDSTGHIDGTHGFVAMLKMCPEKVPTGIK